MRLVLAVFVVAACGGSPSSAGTKWPTPTDKETDGGESLAPRAAASAIAAASTDSGDKPASEPAEPAAATAKPEVDAAKPATSATTQASEETVITTEEIVIEIEE